MSRRGMTLVELLLALALLSGLTIACVSWTTAMDRALLRADSTRAQAARRTLDLVDDALRVGDGGRGGDGVDGRRARIEIEGDAVLVQTRAVAEAPDGGRVLCSGFRLVEVAGVVRGEWVERDQVVASRPLLDGVARLAVSRQDLEDHRVLVTISIEPLAGPAAARGWVFREGEVR